MHDMLRQAEKQLLAHTLHQLHQARHTASRKMGWDGMGCIALCGVGYIVRWNVRVKTRMDAWMDGW